MEPFVKIISIAVGGAFGAVARYLVNISPLANLFEKFHFPTFLINVTGSFLIGFLLIMLTDKIHVSDNLRMAVIVSAPSRLSQTTVFHPVRLVRKMGHLTAMNERVESAVFAVKESRRFLI